MGRPRQKEIDGYAAHAGEVHDLGMFISPESAAKAYNDYCDKLQLDRPRNDI